MTLTLAYLGVSYFNYAFRKAIWTRFNGYGLWIVKSAALGALIVFSFFALWGQFGNIYLNSVIGDYSQMFTYIANACLDFLSLLITALFISDCIRLNMLYGNSPNRPAIRKNNIIMRVVYIFILLIFVAHNAHYVPSIAGGIEEIMTFGSVALTAYILHARLNRAWKSRSTARFAQIMAFFIAVALSVFCLYTETNYFISVGWPGVISNGGPLVLLTLVPLTAAIIVNLTLLLYLTNGLQSQVGGKAWTTEA